MKEKDPAKETAIFAATLELVAEVGLTGLKMANIAKRAQLASGTLYLYFASKEELLNVLYQKLKLGESVLVVDPALAKAPLKLRMRQLWVNSVQHRIGHYNESFFLEQVAHSPYLTEASREATQLATRYVDELLEEGRQQLILKPLPNALIYSLVLGFLREFSTYCRERELSPELLEQSFSLCWDAIKA